MICFVDIDEVLVDFVGGAVKVHGLDLEEVRSQWPQDEWSMTRAMGVTEEEFWGPINEAGEEFWIGLEEKPWLDALQWLVARFFKEAYLVSAPSRCLSSYTGKVRWIKRRFGEGFDKFLLTPHKHLLAAPDRMLIDDRPKNVDRFIEAGGHAILFPHWGNENRDRLHDPIVYLKSELENHSARNLIRSGFDQA